jgi:hypothetical protein
MQKYFKLKENKHPNVPDLTIKSAKDSMDGMEHAGLLIPPGYVVIDFDNDNTDEARYIEWVKQEYPTTWVTTNKGTHFYYKIPKKYVKKWSRGTDIITWVGLQIDFLLTKKETKTITVVDEATDKKTKIAVEQKYAYATVKLNGKVREYNHDPKFTEELPELPRVLYPVKIKTKGQNKKGDKNLSIVGTEDVIVGEDDPLTGTIEGSRDNVLNRQLFSIYAQYPDEEFLDIAHLINELMLNPPYDKEYVEKKYHHARKGVIQKAIPREKKEKFSINFLREYLKDEIKAKLYYDVITKKAVWNNLTVCKDHQIPTYIYNEVNDMSKSSSENVRAYLNYLAFENERNYVLEQIMSVTWDGEDRLKQIYDVLGVHDPFEQTLIYKWLWQSLTLLNNRDKTESESGLGADGCLVLQGKQGIGKTEFFKYLCSFAPKYFLMGAELKFDNKDTLIKAIGHWITELGEVEGTLKKSEVTDLKNFITADEDMVRLPYGRDPRNSPRITSFCASCNSTEFLRDETGNRRFWIVQINQRINRKDMYAIDVLQLWKQIYDQAIVSFENHGFRLSDAEQEENTRRSNDFQVPLKGEDEVRDKLCKITANENHTMEKITVTDWMERVGGFQKCSTRDVAKILTKLGYEVKRGGIDGSRFRILPLIEFLL